MEEIIVPAIFFIVVISMFVLHFVMSERQFKVIKKIDERKAKNEPLTIDDLQIIPELSNKPKKLIGYIVLIILFIAALSYLNSLI